MIWFTLVLSLGQSPVLEFPKQFTGQPSQPIEIKPSQTNGKRVVYAAVSPGLFVFPNGLLKDEKVTVVWAPMPGRYRVLAATAIADNPSEFAQIEVVVGTPPDPIPVPPVPPAPVPVDDPVLEILRPVWGALSEPNKEEKRDKLAKVYAEIAQVYRDQAFLTVGQAFSKASEIRRSMLNDSDLGQLRATVGDEVNKVLPRDPSTVLNQELRDRASATYLRMSRLIASLGK